jgi:hypothetical protein
MPSDRDQLLEFGFEAARVDCPFFPSLCPSLPSQYYITSVSPSGRIIRRTNRQTSAGALKATGGKGLQPAMDHILANQGKPVPDSASISAPPVALAAGGDVDDDEDMKAAIALSQEGEEAKVREGWMKDDWCGR